MTKRDYTALASVVCELRARHDVGHEDPMLCFIPANELAEALADLCEQEPGTHGRLGAFNRARFLEACRAPRRGT